jgi:hypothetical protein
MDGSVIHVERVPIGGIETVPISGYQPYKIAQLINPPKRGKNALEPLSDREPIAASRGVGRPGAEATSPLEKPVLTDLQEKTGARTYYAEESMTSSDGLFVVLYQQPKTTTFLLAPDYVTEIDVAYIEE